MIELPEWDPEFVARSRRDTRGKYLYRAGRLLVLLLTPWGLGATCLSDGFTSSHPFLTILLFFGVVFLLFGLEQSAWAVKHRRMRRAVYRLLSASSELSLLCLSTMLWWLLFPGHIALAIGTWWVAGIGLGLVRWRTRTWALREAVLQTKDYKLFGRRLGRFSKRTKHDKASLHVLADESAFPRHTIMTLVSDEPEIYVSPEARRLLEPDELRTCIAHELGHSWSPQLVGYEFANWVRRMSLVPVLVSATSVLLANTTIMDGPHAPYFFLTLLILIWQINTWASNLLGRHRELAADLYAVEMTRTPIAFANAMAKLCEAEPYNVFPNVPDTLGFNSHPCMMKRLKYVKAALDAAGEAPPQGARPKRRVR